MTPRIRAEHTRRMEEILDYSDHANHVVEMRGIDPSWILLAVTSPHAELRDVHDPELTHALRRIPERGNRVLRVVYNHTVDPPRIVTAYLDRTLKGKL